MKTIRGKRALVTGAASGIGRAIALELARAGADLFLLDVDTDGLGRTADDAKKFAIEVRTRGCDLLQPTEITASVEEMLSEWGDLDILVNGAGVAFYGPTTTMTAEQWNWLLGINLHAPIQLTRELLPVLLERPEAHILNVASIGGLVAGPRLTAYFTSKFGLVGFSESLRADLAGTYVGVTALCPGLVRTNLWDSAVQGRNTKRRLAPPTLISTTPEKVAAKALKAIRRNRGLQLVTLLAHALYLLKRVSPTLLDRLGRIGRRKKRRPQAAPPGDLSHAAAIATKPLAAPENDLCTTRNNVVKTAKQDAA
jgi:short-subunit dehydrogenase